MKRIVGMITTLFVVLVTLVGLSSPSFADTQPTTTVTNTSSSVSTDQAAVTSSAHIDTNVSSNTVFYVTATGMPASQVQSAIYHHHVVTLTRGMTLWTSYINVYGHEVWHWKYYAAGHKFYLGPDGYYHDRPCNNKVIVPHAKPLPSNAHKLYGSIIVKQYRTWVATAQAKVTLTVKASATASCGNAANGATASATGYGYAYAYATATVRGTSSLNLNAKAVTLANQLKMSVSFTDQQKAAATAQAGGSASASASAKVTCTSTPSYSVPTVSASAQACVNQGGTSGIVNVVGSNPNNVAAEGSIVFDGRPAQDVGQVAAGGTASASFGYVAPGTYQVTFSLGAPINMSATTTVTVAQCPEQPSSIVSVEQPNDVLYGNSRTIEVKGVVPSGQTATLMSSANIGSIAPSDQSMVVSGNFDVLIHYTAPTEGSSDTFTVKLYSQSGHLDDTKSVTFALTNPNPPPM